MMESSKVPPSPAATHQPALHGVEQMRRFHDDGSWSTRLLVDHFDEQARCQPDKPAIVEAHRTLDYREVARQTENVAAALAALGIGHGDVVAVQAPNWAELPIVHLAADRIGAIFVPLSEGFREREIEHLLRRSRARVVFCPERFRDFGHLEQVLGMRDTLPDLEHVVVLRGAASGETLAFDRLADDDGWRTVRGRVWLDSLRADADAPSHVMVSSGTTGLPRCSLFSDNNTVVKLLRQYSVAVRLSPDDLAAGLAPAGTGATGYNYPILTMLLIGGTSVMLEHWSGGEVDGVLDLIESHRCSIVVAVPAQLAKLIQASSLAGRDFSALRVITYSGAKLPASVAADVERLFGCIVQGIYGSSEAGATAMTRIDDPQDKRLHSVGRPVPDQEVRIVAEDGSSVAPREVGEVCWRGPNKSYGFLNDHEGSAQIWDAEGLMHSGDLGRIDEAGYLHIVGRKKDMIIRGGQNVNPGAIEDVLLRHPAVAEVAVVAFEDRVLGERIAACIVARNEPPSLQSLKAMIIERGMAVWHQPEMLVCVPELPRNAGGKIDKKLLSALATAHARNSIDTVGDAPAHR